MNLTKGSGGYTLSELLVGVTITGLVAALIVPVIGNLAADKNEAANQKICASNLHQISLALMMYQEDNDGILPRNMGDPTMCPARGQIVIDPLLSYVHNVGIFHCPDHAPAEASWTGAPGDARMLNAYGYRVDIRSDYEYRVRDMLELQDDNNQPKRIMKPEPSTVLVYDSNHVQSNTKSYLILRADGSVSSCPYNSTALWSYVTDAQWKKSDIMGPAQFPRESVFPDEPWPPQFEKQ